MIQAIRKLAALSMLAPLLLLGGAISSAAAMAPNHARSHAVFPGTITVSYPVAAVIQDYPLRLAEDTGIYAKYGLTVNVEIVSATVLDAALESGALQFTVASAPGVEFAYQEGVPVKMIGLFAEHNADKLLVRPGITSIAGLAGHTVGTSSPTAFGTIVTKYVLHLNGVPFSSVTPVPAGANPLAQFLAGQFDAFTAEPSQVRQAAAALPGSTALYNFINLLWPAGEVWGYLPFISTHKAETVAFLRALNAALVKWNSDSSLADHEISIYDNTSSPSTIAAAYTSTQQIINKGRIPLHLPSTHILSFVNKVLRETGFPNAANSYAEKGQEWTDAYWNAAFLK